ncbi:MAG: hypothetical protein ACRDJN_05150, partial [Chloroflexota bacterium]
MSHRVQRRIAAVALFALLTLLVALLAGVRGRETDFFPRWYGLRELLLTGQNPYSNAVTREIASQTWFLAG